MPRWFKLRWITIPGLLLIAGLLVVGLLQAQSTAGSREQDSIQATPDDGRADAERARRRAERRQLLQFRVLERISKMAPEDRERMISRLPEARRKRVQEGLRWLDTLSPEQRQQLVNQLQRFSQMSPERQQRLRGLVRELTAHPPHRREALRREFQSLQRMTDAQQRERIESAEFKGAYSEAERRLILDLVENAPPPPARGRSGPSRRGPDRR
jgi:hypothetical protein